MPKWNQPAGLMNWLRKIIMGVRMNGPMTINQFIAKNYVFVDKGDLSYENRVKTLGIFVGSNSKDEFDQELRKAFSEERTG